MVPTRPAGLACARISAVSRRARSSAMWTFGKKIAAGFALSFTVLLAIGLVSYRGLDGLTQTSYRVDHTHQVLDRLALLRNDLIDAETGQRGFIITGDPAFLEPYTTGSADIDSQQKALRELTADNPRQQERLDALAPLVKSKLDEVSGRIEIRRTAGFDAAAKEVSAGTGRALMDKIRGVLRDMADEERALLSQRADEVESTSSSVRTTIIVGTLLGLLLVAAAGFFITRSLSGQIGSAVRHVQSSSAELQAAANQQATGAKEQSTAMNEIATTITELLATSRQIADSAKRVAHIAGETEGAARSGDHTVQRTQDSVLAIRRQVDVIVAHMLELGKKSQQIGGVLEIINELAEQTNILAINATIEAVGAGDSGRRFAVVADEIRKLADRVGGSTKEIRGLVDDIRAAVNTTVMATESGSKAVDAGARQFGDVTTAFKQIAGMVTTTTDASREIELSTKQQSTAVEQVIVAIGSVSQAAKETESSSAQTLQTASELATLSRNLTRLIQPQALG
ncbi:MAG: CHASE3 domain-containing protein [Myxococcota bacterium]